MIGGMDGVMTPEVSERFCKCRSFAVSPVSPVACVAGRRCLAGVSLDLDLEIVLYRI
jgi:hypothetical protein